MTMADLSTILISETAVSLGGTLCWMSPELLGSDALPTCESDCYALGMVVYEVGWSSPSQWSHRLPITGSDRSPTVPPSARLEIGISCIQRRASRKATRCRISRFLPRTLGVGGVVLERIEFSSTNRPAAVRPPFPCLSHLGSTSSVPCHRGRCLRHYRFGSVGLFELIPDQLDS